MTFWNSVKDFVEKFSASGTGNGELDAEDLRLAAAALLVHAMVVDGKVDEREQKVLHSALEGGFKLDRQQADDLILQATDREKETPDFHAFTGELRARLNHETRMEILGMLWQVVNADGVVDESEGSFILRAAQALGISLNDWANLRKQLEGGSA